MWSGENDFQGPMQLDSDGIRLPRADLSGIHWMPFLNAPGTGHPLFGQVQTMRQIKCMRGPRCQVCGEKMDKTDCTWVLNSETDPKPSLAPGGARDQGMLRTGTPPTCRRCIPIAHELCPHLVRIQPLPVLTVTRYKVSAVFGDMFLPGGGGRPLGQCYVTLDDRKNLRWLLARMLVVDLYEYKINYYPDEGN